MEGLSARMRRVLLKAASQGCVRRVGGYTKRAEAHVLAGSNGDTHALRWYEPEYVEVATGFDTPLMIDRAITKGWLRPGAHWNTYTLTPAGRRVLGRRIGPVIIQQAGHA